MTSELLTAFVTLFVIIDPPGLAPLFIALTRGIPREAKRRIALRACIGGAVLLTMFGLFGEAVMGVIGISLPAFRIAGGILLFLTALDMLFERRTRRRESTAEANEPAHDPSIFPLSMPLIAGPGAIATMILLTGQSEDIGWLISVNLVMLVVIAMTFAALLASEWLERLLGPVGIVVVTRLLGMLLAALSVQFVIDGVLAVI
jgi:multiple antibiotic resistance protein